MGTRTLALTAMLGTFAMAAIAASGTACSSDDGAGSTPPPLATGAPVRRDAAIEAAPPPPPRDASTGPVDAGAKARHFAGTLAATPPSDFGGSPYCKYKMTLKQIEIDVTIDGAGDPANASVTDLAVEETVPPCTFAPTPASIQKFTLASSSKLPAGGLHLELSGDPGNKTATALLLEGDFAGDTVQATLEWHRTDQPAPLDWRVTTTIPLTLR
jgi:hypothetical protein